MTQLRKQAGKKRAAYRFVELTREGLPKGFLAPFGERAATRFEIRRDGIAIITLARPESLNAFNERMIREVRSALWHCTFDDHVRVIIVTGEGRAFCSGRDIQGLQWENDKPSFQYRAYVRTCHEMMDDFEQIEKPVIAAVNGICAGGGVEMAVACDLRFAASNAQFLLPENQLGVIPASGACSRMIQLIGIGRLKEMVIGVEPVSARVANRIGLVNRVFPANKLMKNTIAYAQKLTGKAPLAMGMAKHIINTCQSADLETGRILERLGQSVLNGTEDQKEGTAAFIEKRKPRFKGR